MSSDGPLLLTAPATSGTWFETDDDLAIADRMARLPPEERSAILEAAREESELDLDELRYDFRFWGRPSQLYAYDSEAHITAILSGRGWGKLLHVFTPVPTPSGWTTMGALQPGDVVLDEQGSPTTVTWTSDPETPRRAYRLHFSDGTFIDACADHQWVTWTHQDRKQFLRLEHAHGLPTTRFPDDWASFEWRSYDRWGRVKQAYHPSVKTTQQIVDTFTQGSREDLNHCIPLTAPLRLPPADLPLDPWLLGYWLANGAVGGGSVIAGSKDGDFDAGHVEAMISATGYGRFSRRDYPDKGQTRFNMPGLSRVLTGLGVVHNKHVPAIYLRASIEQRLALLRGLCDGDGYTGGNNQVEYTSMSPHLADGVVELLRSLGEKPVLGVGRARLNGVDHGEKYRIKWRPSVSNPFALPRKASLVTQPQAQGLRNRHRMITSYELLDDPPLMRCISVDSPNSMYLAGEAMIPTHNTHTLSSIAHKLAEKYPGSRGALVARTTNDVRATLVKGESGLLETVPPDRRPKYVPNNREVTWPNGTVAHTFTASVPDMLRGPQFHWALCISRGTLVQTGRGLVPIEEVNGQDTVLVRDGRYVPLLMGARLTRHDAQVVRIVTSHQTLDLTPDHRVATPGGWVEARDLSPNDKVIGWDCFQTTFPNDSRSTGRRFTSNERAATTSAVATASTTTEQSGRKPTDRSLMDTTSITRTTSPGTTIRRIWSSLRRRFIGLITALPSTSTFAQPQPSSCGTGDEKQLVSMSVSSATSRSSPSGCEPRTARRSAETTQRPIDIDQEVNVGRTPRTSLRRVWDVARNSLRRLVGPSTALIDARSVTTGLALEQVVSVKPVPRQDVFDLTTADPDFPEFFANGILVHNCDEGASWPDRPPAGSIANAWDNVKLATRLGDHPQIFMATTPRRVPMVVELINGTHSNPSKYRVIRGATSANRHLVDIYHSTIVEMYQGTSLARQELGGELLGDVAGALLRMDQIPRLPVTEKFDPRDYPVRIVAIDPSVSDKPRDECGIVVIVATNQRDLYRRKAFVVADESLHGSPGTWAKRAVNLARKYRAFIVAEDNQGGEMVRTVIHIEDDEVPVVLARSEASKAVRAEPVVLGYERHQIVHTDHFGELESQLTSWVPDESKYSPDRLDALVIGCSAALVTQPSGMSGRIRLGRSPNSPSARNRIPTSQRPTVQHQVETAIEAAYRPQPRLMYAREDRSNRRERFAERRRRRQREKEATAVVSVSASDGESDSDTPDTPDENVD